MEPKRPKLTPEEKNIQKDCQEAEIAALKQKLVDMETKLMRVTAELEQVKNERSYDKINFETEKYELESKYKEQFSELESKYKEQFSELESKYKEQCSELESKYKEQCSELESKHKEQCSELESKHKEQCSELESKHKEQCSELESKHKQQCSELKRENEKLHRYLQDLESSNIESKINLWNINLNSQTTKVNINDFPNEVIEKIFSFLTQNQLGQIARVCKKWSMLTKSPVLWRKVNVTMFRNPDRKNDIRSFESLVDGLPSCVTFIRLEFSACVGYLDFEEVCMKLHQKCPQVEVLIIRRCYILTILPKVIDFCTQFLPGLKKLVLHTCQFEYHFGTVEHEDNSKIEVLDLNCSVFSYYSKIQLSKLRSLNELRLNKTKVDNAWFVDDTLWNQLHDTFWNQLRVLDLGWSHVTARSFLTIQRHGQNLKELYFCGLPLDDYEFIFNNPVFLRLETICLYDTYVIGEGLVSLIQSCPSLVSVYVREDVARSFAEHPFIVANRCKSGIVKSIGVDHDHDIG